MERYHGLLHPEQLAMGEATPAFYGENQEACYWDATRGADRGESSKAMRGLPQAKKGVYTPN